jgi:hypothetical protein
MESINPRPWPVVPEPVPHSSKPLRRLASIVSYVFHPVFMPAIMAIALYLLSPIAFKSLPPTVLKFRLATVVMLTIFFPLFSVLLMKKLDFIQSIHMRDPKDRIIPLITIMIFYFWVQQVFSNLKDSPPIIKILMLGAFWGIILLFLISIFFKVSMHATAAGGMVGILIVLLFISPVNMLAPLLVSLVIAGLIGSARLILGEHRPPEIWLGYIIGIAVQLAAWAYVL